MIRDEDSDDEEEEEEEEREDLKIEWRNIVFLQFHPLFQGVILVAVVVKTMLGPISAVFPNYIYCNLVLTSETFIAMRFLYMYCVTPVVLLDLFLHIMHRQMSDLARQREHKPKSAFLLLLDVVGITPLFSLTSDNECPPLQLWPNILALVEIILIYRVTQYFGLKSSHSIWNLSLGFTTLFVIIANALTCFWLLLTIYGLCARCNNTYYAYDWRYFLTERNLHFRKMSFELYSYAAMYLCSSLLSYVMCNIVSRTWIEVNTNNLLQILAYALITHIVRPRIFCEAVLKLKKKCYFQLHVVKVIMETKRRTSDTETINNVEKFYQLLLIRRNGIMSTPPLLNELPHYLVVRIKEDLVWPIFYHTPILRSASVSYKRYIAQRVEFDFKIPGEKLLSGHYTHGNLIYLKSGMIQFMCSDDKKTPLISARSGTVIGDINFILPPRNIKAIARCATYCEIYYIKREVLISALQKFPIDRKAIIARVRDKLNHARNLYATKKNVGVIDITEDLGISWLKRRWMELSYLINIWRKDALNVRNIDVPQITPEEMEYRCSKYIGQIVMASNMSGNRKVIQKNNFPWVFVPSSDFLKIWEKIVKLTVSIVFIFFPPYLRQYSYIVPWFSNFELWVDIIYTLDMMIFMSVPLDTASVSIDFVNVLLSRFKTITFFLNLLSTPLLSMLSKLVGLSQHYRLCQFSRLVKIYVFYVETYSKPPVNRDPFMDELIKNMFHFLAYVYISSYIVYLISDNYIYGLDREFFFCDFVINSAIQIPIYWFSVSYTSGCATTFMESVYLKIILGFFFYFTNIIVKAKVFAITYIKYKESITCQLFVSSMLSKYKLYQVHPHLINRLTKYTACYWKLYRGSDFLVAEDMLKEEPYDVYYKVRGQFAESTIMNSSAFRGADISLIKDLAYKSKFLIVPRYSTLFSFGTQGDTVSWVINGQIKCEYYDKSGALVSKMYPKGEILSLSSVFFGKISMRTFIAHTDCEVMNEVIHFKLLLAYENLKILSEIDNQCSSCLQNDIRCHRFVMQFAAVYDVVDVIPFIYSTSFKKIQIIHINIHAFKGILDNYPQEKKNFEVCRAELGPAYDKMLKNYIKKHRELIARTVQTDSRGVLKRRTTDLVPNEITRGPREFAVSPELQVLTALRCWARNEYVKNKAKKGEVFKPKIREKILKSIKSFIHVNREAGSWRNRVEDFFSRLWIDPSKKFMRYWLPFRAAVTLTSVVAGALEGSVAVKQRAWLAWYLVICDTLTVIDMILKCFVAHYDSRGVLIHAPRMRLVHYISRSFIPDFIGVFPWVTVGNFFTTVPVSEMDSILWDCYARCAHLYIFLSYCNYMSDWPNSNGIMIMCIKSQILSMCLKIIAAQHLLGLCYDAVWDNKFVLLQLTLIENGTCFFNKELGSYDENKVFLHLYGRSLLVAQFNTMGANFGKPSTSTLAEINVVLYFPFFVMDIIFWYINITCTIHLFLYFKKNSLLKEDVKQLNNFLVSERVDKMVIHRTRAHFKYWWNRSGGMSIMNPLMQRVGIVLRQDMMLYMYKETLDNLGQIIAYNSHTKRALATMCEPIYLLPGEDIMREMRIVRYVYIVHRGRVTVTLKGRRLASLSKGAIFGQLSGGKEERGIKVTARADELVDLLTIPHSQFQCIFSDKVKASIAELAVNDYIPMKNIKAENPYNSIQYLTRGVPTVYFPRAKAPRSIKSCQYYAAWLQTAWLVGPLLGAFSSGILVLKAPTEVIVFCGLVVLISDAIHLVYLIIEFFYSVRLKVLNNSCVLKRDRREKLKEWWLYVEILSILLIIHIPLTGFVDFHCIRLLRLKYLYNYRRHFCNSFKKSYKLSMLYAFCVIISIMFTIFTRLKFECEDKSDAQSSLPKEIIYLFINEDEYVLATDRSQGCNIYYPIPPSYIRNDNETVVHVRPKTWYGDFAHASGYILQFNFNYLEMDPENTHFINWLHVWFEMTLYSVILMLHLFMTGKALAFMYLKYRMMLRYDYRVANLLNFLQLEGITKTFSVCVEKYCRQLWERQKGNWLPELTMEAPECLKEDIMCTLYYHHLQLPPLFRPIPEYFLRQLATKFHRLVIFAGIDIVRKGDILPNIFFIHEGEVEKYYIDSHGERRVITVLTTNGYFGFFASMYPNTPYAFNYATRTVVDLIYLKHADWQHLLDAYPDVSNIVKDIAKQMKKESLFKQ